MRFRLIFRDKAERCHPVITSRSLLRTLVLIKEHAYVNPAWPP
jgi:hypothetical protein